MIGLKERKKSPFTVSLHLWPRRRHLLSTLLSPVNDAISIAVDCFVYLPPEGKGNSGKSTAKHGAKHYRPILVC